MVVTMLEARVDEEMISGLVDSFNASGDSLPSPIVESFLIRERNSDIWRIVTVWESQEALDGYRTSVDTPEGVLMFRAAGTEPSLSISEVSAHVSHK
jgi:hypothetical protein